MLELTAITEESEQRILDEVNATTQAYPHDKCVHQLFEAQVERSPSAIAVRFSSQYLTYAELNQRANQLAHYLQSLGVGPEVVVGICLERSLSMAIGLLGILKAGGAYIPLDSKFPQDRLACILEDAHIDLLLTQESLLDALPQHKAKTICIDTAWQTILSQCSDNLAPLPISENLVYIIFTSGSTGRPKGVEILHRSVVNFLTSMAQQPGLTSQDILLSVTTLSFDIAALEIFLPLIVGAQVVIASRDDAADGAKLLELLNGITVMQATPATWRLLINAGWNGNQQLKILCGGEALPRVLASQLLERCRELWNVYGPTETTIWSTVTKVEESINSAIIGRLLANTQVYIVDENICTVPLGDAGELLIGGDGLARGYLNRPELTQEKFIPNPFAPQRGRLYRTGDLARFLGNGKIELFGRIDQQVKIRGFRIELGEIETALNLYTGVLEAVVVAQEYAAEGKRLVAYIVPQPGQSLTTKELANLLKGKLPDYMVPSAFVFLDALPLTPNNKVDRRALPQPTKADLNLEEGYQAAVNDLEQQLVNIWEEVLSIQPIGVRDNFFTLGGNSLLAASLVTEIAKKLGKSLSPAIFFEASTIEQLAYLLEEKPITTSTVVKIQKGTKTPLFVIGNSFLYRQLISNIEPDQPIYAIEEPLGNVQEMANRCLKEIRSIQPHGYYHLLGHSFEGLVAYEIAQQLHREHQQVAFLGLIDTPTPQLEIQIDTGSALNRIYLRLKIVFGLSWSDRLSWLRERAQHKMREIASPLMPTLHGFIREYVPQPYLGNLTLFSATHEFYAVSDRYLGWSQLAKTGIEVYEIPGSHRSILLERSKARILSQQLQKCLNYVSR